MKTDEKMEKLNMIERSCERQISNQGKEDNGKLDRSNEKIVRIQSSGMNVVRDRITIKMEIWHKQRN